MTLTTTTIKQVKSNNYEEKKIKMLIWKNVLLIVIFVLK